MRFSVLGSGSRGNSVYIESGKTAILIDGGFSGKELAKRLHSIDRDLSNITAVCVTHEHNDHICGVGVISRRYNLPVLANQGTFGAGEKRLGKLSRRVEFETGDLIELQDLTIRSFRISHDTADPVGFVIGDGRVTLGCCTDTGKATRLMERRLACCNGLVLEFNHNLEMLKMGPYPLALQQRVRSSQGHLSNEDGADFLKKIVSDRLQMVVLAHLSDTNNTPKLALDAAERIFSSDISDFELVVASQERATPLMSLI
ncbi:MAG: MBL fold metallo-hydrolase [Deltaproteobacteria bacterium]|nr:MBL fold metallo-hydrolase [Deltaproteobacteria bacterium]MBW2659968.1 MBL fold metallo-hydrolase [Deltaproteobacteria bacterium]